MSYTITAVSPQVRDWNSTQGGPMKAYRVTLKGADGIETANVELSRKATSPAPTIGQEIEGTLDTSGQYGPRFKAAPGARSFGPRPEDPKRSAGIQRMHSQSCALEFLALMHQKGKLEDDQAKLEMVWKIADQFDADVNRKRDAA